MMQVFSRQCPISNLLLVCYHFICWNGVYVNAEGLDRLGRISLGLWQESGHAWRMKISLIICAQFLAHWDEDGETYAIHLCRQWHPDLVKGPVFTVSYYLFYLHQTCIDGPSGPSFWSRYPLIVNITTDVYRCHIIFWNQRYIEPRFKICCDILTHTPPS